MPCFLQLSQMMLEWRTPGGERQVVQGKWAEIKFLSYLRFLFLLYFGAKKNKFWGTCVWYRRMQILFYDASSICKPLKHTRHMSCPYQCNLSRRLISWDGVELRHKQHDKNIPTPLAPHLFSSSSFAPLIEGQACEAEKCRFIWSKMLMSPALMCVSFKSKIELDGWRWETAFTVTRSFKMSFVKAARATTMPNRPKY